MTLENYDDAIKVPACLDAFGIHFQCSITHKHNPKFRRESFQPQSSFNSSANKIPMNNNWFANESSSSSDSSTNDSLSGSGNGGSSMIDRYWLMNQW